MGRPNHYSRELPARCQALIEGYADMVAADAALSERFRGPLMTTFVLAMATPMLVLPMERLYRPASGDASGVADDQALDPLLAKRVIDTLGGANSFGAAPFFRENAWRYVASCDFFPVGRDWPDDRLDMLASDAAASAARNAPVGDVLWAIRHSLAHGGVTYLDENGRQGFDATNMLGFVSYVKGTKRQQVRLVRVGVEDFRVFLSLWAGWLADVGVEHALDEPGFFETAE
jgi:hypothetical protein